jgi:uncharacterized protein (TIGR02452 family)
MENLYIVVYEITETNLRKVANQKVDSSAVCRFSGIEFKFLYIGQQFFQIKVYAYNQYSTILLGASIENSGYITGGQYDSLMLAETDGGFAGILCSYVFVVSKQIINDETIIQVIRNNTDGLVSSEEGYRKLREKIELSERITGFKELIHHLERDTELGRQTWEMSDRTRMYYEGFSSLNFPNREGDVSFQENLTLLAAKEPAKMGKHTAILSFANPVEPGGGTLRGANAQEESICRASNLYKALTSASAYYYYKINNSIRSKNQFNSMFLGTDNVLYSPDVLILKEDGDYRRGYASSGVERYMNHPFRVDVITCAAPFFSGSGYILPNGDLQHLFEKRIRNILEAAIDNKVEVLILGAFGCGAFHNPPEIVAEAFRNVLLETRYRCAFDKVIFAVKRTKAICPIIDAFEERFSLFPKINIQGNEKMMKEYIKIEEVQ